MEVRDKFTGDLLREVRENTRSEAEEMISRGIASCDDRDSLPRDELAKNLMSISEAIVDNADSLSVTISRETGKALKRAREEVAMTSDEFRMAAHQIYASLQERSTIPVESFDDSLMTFHKQSPLGVILVFISPLESFSHSAKVFANAISSGNSVVCVPPLLSPGPYEELKTMMETSGLSKDSFQTLILAENSRTAKDLIRNEGVGKVVILGRQSEFSHIMKETPGNNVLIGGETASPVIIWDDADLDAAAQYVTESAFYQHNGGYSSARKIILREDSYEYFKNRLIELASNIQVGDPSDEDTDVGPFPHEVYVDESSEDVLEAVNKGASVIIGGVRNRNLFPPTIMEYLPDDSPLLRGIGNVPVLGILQVNSLDEAIRNANDFSDHIQVSIFTSDIDLATTASEKLDFANVLINEAPGSYSSFWHRSFESVHRTPEKIADLRKEFSKTKIVKLKK